MLKIIKLILIILCMSLIFYLSNDNKEQSTSKSDNFIKKVVTILKKDLSQKEQKEIIEKYTFIVRKSAHFFIYFILGILLISYVSEFRQVNIHSILFAIFISFLYACSDEIHQLFVDGRSAKLLDVCIDTLGASLGCFIYHLLFKIKNNKNISTN